MTRPTSLILAVALLAAACGTQAADSAADVSDGQTPAASQAQPTPEDQSPAPPEPEAEEAGADTGTTGNTETTAEPSTTEASTRESEPAPTSAQLVDWPVQALDFLVVAEASKPVDLAPRADTNDLYIAEKAGRVKVIEVTRSGTGQDQYAIQPVVVLDLSGAVSSRSEQGLLGLAFSPDGTRLYVNYTDRAGDTVIEEFTMNGRVADVATRRVVLAVDQPFSNHNGGGLRFGPDGFLYVGLGDGGRGGDPLDSGQTPSTLLGSVLRIDPVGGTPYAIPSDNPFVNATDGTAPETWLYGARNPWRYSFDADTGDFWIADVGQDKFEEINFLPADTGSGRGANLGWNETEGTESFKGGTPPADYVAPIHAYSHRNSRCSVTGGFVYRGQDIPSFEGVYVFGDFCSGEIFGLELGASGKRVERLTAALPRGRLASFGEDNRGELFVLDIDGRVLKVIPK